MRLRALAFDWLEPHREFGPVFIRAIVGWHLIHGTQDNVFDPARMLEFRDFLAQHHFVWPTFNAHLSAWAQFLCGGLFVLGWWTRPAAAVMVVNFLVALWMVHRGRPYPENALAFLMLFGALFLLVHGPGRWSLDGWRAARHARPEPGPPADAAG